MKAPPPLEDKVLRVFILAVIFEMEDTDKTTSAEMIHSAITGGVFAQNASVRRVREQLKHLEATGVVRKEGRNWTTTLKDEGAVLMARY